jgi:hypothetical protein
MAKSVALGFVYGAATPIALAIIAATIFAGGSLFAIPLTGTIAVIMSAPVAVGLTLIFGVPLYFAYRRLHITSWFAYVATGLAFSLPVAAWALWEEYSGGYESARQALFQHTIEVVCLLSGPAAAAVFWRTVRPDLPGAKDSGPATDAEILAMTLPSDGTSNNRRGRGRRICVIALGMVPIAWLGFGIYDATKAPRARSMAPLEIEYFSFDPTKSADLIASLDGYARAHSAHMAYYFMPLYVPQNPNGAPAMPSVLVVAELHLPDGIEVIVSNPGSKGLSASIYSETNRSAEQSNQIWSDFIPFLRSAVAHANSLAPNELPNVGSQGEGGVLETHWWDWRSHRK